MVVLIFDTNGGLCNQFYDIFNGINFCLTHNLFFTFRYCAFRNDYDLTRWTEQPFGKIFDLNLFNKYELYIDYDTIKDKLTDDNCYNRTDKMLSYIIFNNNNILEQFINLNKEYVVLKQFWSLYNSPNVIDNTIYKHILPSNDIMEKYIEIKNAILPESYNFIHYRYESDFTNHFKLKVDSLDSLIDNIKFKNNNLKIYIATSHIKNILDLNNCKYANIIYKNDDMLMNFNFEQRAFIDYMIGLHSVECYGHKNSSFSHMINNLKGTDNFYA